MRIEHLLYEMLTDTTSAQPIIVLYPEPISILYPWGIDHNTPDLSLIECQPLYLFFQIYSII